MVLIDSSSVKADDVSCCTKNCHIESETCVCDDDTEQVKPRFRWELIDEWKTGILEVSRTISQEALDVLYGQHVFVARIHGEDHKKLAGLSIANLRRIRRLRIVAQPMGISYGPDQFVFDVQMWRPLLEGLSQLCIVAQQPLEARGYFGAPTFTEDMDEWLAWLGPILENLSKAVSGYTCIGLDADESLETTALMDRYFAARYQNVKTRTGDLCFKRGIFSLQSGYWDSD